MLSIFNPRANLLAFQELILLLTRHRRLTIEMARREITDRYAGQFFGAFWAIGHPLILMLVYVFIFGFVFKTRISNNVNLPLDYTTYILCGLIPWLAFIEAMSKAVLVIVSNANLVKQVVFPIEVLPIKGVIATLVTQFIFLGLLMFYALVIQRVFLWTYCLIPVLIVLQALAMIGVSYILSAIGVFFRDTKDFIQVFSTIGVYLIPAFYLPESVPAIFRGVLYLNPFSYMIWSYQDALYYGKLAHPWAWLAMLFLSLTVFVYGYRFFRKVKTSFGNVL
jgi:lipopolysaccharide transport system permease protein